ncbi:LacI family DNA-binding transcriptional regulator [Burkholderia sp. 22PA0106]|uniref:LacI family DNA-binding transcriptional regulator n=1 Tax=Burkholderia sp. 22PA0106 TaxID=3237371 RepID=UPI0039C2CC8F
MTQTKRPARVTSYDVALAAEVSQSTVSRCFQPDSPISPETRSHVLKVAETLGFRPNALARSLILGRSNVIALIATKYTLRFNPDVLYVIGDALKAQRTKLLLIPVDEDAQTHDALADALEFPLDGVIACANLALDDIRSFQRHGVPIVMFNRQTDAPRVDSVTTDNQAGAQAMAERLHRAGHRRILCLGGPEQAPVSQLRIAAFVARMKALGAAHLEVLHSDFSYAQGYALMMAQGERARSAIDAVYCANDQLALGALDACRYGLSLEVPADISIVGFDDIEEAARPPYRLTTLRQPIDELANEALRLLSSRLERPTIKARHLSIPAVFVERASARVADSDPTMQRQATARDMAAKHGSDVP